MKNVKKAVLRTALIALAASAILTLAACDDGSVAVTWSPVYFFSDVDGTWKGSHSYTLSMEEYAKEVGSEWTTGKAAKYGAMNVTLSLDVTAVFDKTARTEAWTIAKTQTFSGGNISTAWDTIKTGYTEVDDARHAITETKTENSWINIKTVEKEQADYQERNGYYISMHADGNKLLCGIDGLYMILTKQ